MTAINAAHDLAERPLADADMIAAFKACTRSFPERYRAQIAAGMTDAELARALDEVIGILGGASARTEIPAIAYKGAGLKTWASWDSPDMRDRPIFAGEATVALARQLYAIPNPSDMQMRLF